MHALIFYLSTLFTYKVVFFFKQNYVFSLGLEESNRIQVSTGHAVVLDVVFVHHDLYGSNPDDVTLGVHVTPGRTALRLGSDVSCWPWPWSLRPKSLSLSLALKAWYDFVFDTSCK